MHSADFSAKAKDFLKIAPQFQLGELPTEMSNAKTTQLSQLAQSDLPTAIAILQEVEIAALDSITPNLDRIRKLSQEMHNTIATGGRVFFCGCGATGRLSLALETLWREEYTGQADSVLSFIAGGDYALVRSIENFEDHPEYGARQLRDLGFGANDLLVATTEGGETPFVIGAAEEAEKISKRHPWFMFCNPADILVARLERSRRVLQNPRIESVSLQTGPMAVAGSTRMQASTVLMLAAGAALFARPDQEIKDPLLHVENFRSQLKSAALKDLAKLIEAEAAVYASHGYCLHETREYGITVLTDTTERSPTFSLLPFENKLDPKQNLSWTYVAVPRAEGADDAWRTILKRKSRPLPWPEFQKNYGPLILNGFDFDPSCRARREKFSSSPMHVFKTDPQDGKIVLAFEGFEARLARPKHRLVEHLLLKSAFNISSTLVMGRLGRFSGNRMVYVKATNNKLIDRSIRCIRQLQADRGLKPVSYEEVAYALFEVLESTRPDEPAVLKTLDFLASTRL
jgi:N-acetylmuramic acid 6-phosphate etherase